MAKLIWSPRAARDLEEICSFIGRDSGHYARLFAQKVIEVIEAIPDFPRSGRVVPEYNQKQLREKLHQNYRIVYRIKPDVVEIVAIVHGMRLLNDIEKQD